MRQCRARQGVISHPDIAGPPVVAGPAKGKGGAGDVGREATRGRPRAGRASDERKQEGLALGGQWLRDLPSCRRTVRFGALPAQEILGLAEYDNGAAASSPSREYIYAGWALLARIDSSGTKYFHQDQVSNRLVSDGSGNVVEELGTYPFGESWYNASGEKLLFTSYERDAESINDYAMARSYVNRLARFSSPAACIRLLRRSSAP
jgi:hypothetical protein